MSIQTILEYASTFKMTTVSGGCTRDRLTLMERCTGGNQLDIPPTDLTEDDYTGNQTSFILAVKIGIMRARWPYEHNWRWEPGAIEFATINFYHIDYDKLIAYASDWLVSHEDTGVTGKYNKNGHVVKCIKYAKIGQVRHHTNPPDYDK